MTARKHSEMIKAWADNDELVTLVKGNNGWVSIPSPYWDRSHEHFICHEKHEDAVLALLNGGEARIFGVNKYSILGSGWVDIKLSKGDQWEVNGWYMVEKYESRVKPKKQTRYAYAFSPEGAVTVHYGSIEELQGKYPGVESSSNFQLVTFEIEV